MILYNKKFLLWVMIVFFACLGVLFLQQQKFQKKKVKKQNFDCFLMMLMIFFSFFIIKKKVKMKNKYGSGRPLFFFLFIYRFWYLVIYSHTYTIFKLPKSIFTYPFTFIFFFLLPFYISSIYHITFTRMVKHVKRKMIKSNFDLHQAPQDREIYLVRR